MLWSNGNTLTFEVMRGLHCLYSVPLVDLYGSEKDLNAGRFENFSIVPLEYSIKVPSDSNGQAEFQYRIRQHVEWIAEHGRGLWSLTLEPHHVSKLDLIYSFSDVTDAVLFKLVWF
jgi:hypothetical protein